MFVIYKKSLKAYEESEYNKVRSVAVYYSGGITGKQKYRKIYRHSCYRLTTNKSKNERLAINNCHLPSLVPYNHAMPYIKSISLGTIHSISDKLCDGLDDCDRVNGCYCNLVEMLVKPVLPIKLCWANIPLHGLRNHTHFLQLLEGMVLHSVRMA